jgi:hypothetical protein
LCALRINREEILLSSVELLTAARVVQNATISTERQLSAKAPTMYAAERRSRFVFVSKTRSSRIAVRFTVSQALIYTFLSVKFKASLAEDRS